MSGTSLAPARAFAGRLTPGRHLLPSIDIVQRLMKVFAVSADNLLNDNENSVLWSWKTTS